MPKLNIKAVLLVLLNITAITFFLNHFASLQLYYCGQVGDPPLMAMDLYPNWGERRMQFNIGAKEIIGDTRSDKPKVRSWIEGAELFKKITAYDVNSGDLGLYFKAYNWDGIEQTFFLQGHQPSQGEKHRYKITQTENRNPNKKWASIGPDVCMGAVARHLLDLFFILVIFLDVRFVLRFLWFRFKP